MTKTIATFALLTLLACGPDPANDPACYAIPVVVCGPVDNCPDGPVEVPCLAGAEIRLYCASPEGCSK